MLTEFLLLQNPRITLKTKLGDDMNIYQTKIIRVLFYYLYPAKNIYVLTISRLSCLIQDDNSACLNEMFLCVFLNSVTLH